MAHRKTRRKNASAVTISAADIARARRNGPRAVHYYREHGLREARHRAFNIAASGLIPLVGLFALGWSPQAMLLFMLIDAMVTVVADVPRYLLAKRWIAASHQRDHDASDVLLICDGLEDGTGTRPERGKDANPLVILVIALVCSPFLVIAVAAAAGESGMASWRTVIAQPAFVWLAGLDALWRLGGGVFGAWRIRASEPGEELMFLESGSVAALYAGMLILVWLPLNWGEPGLLALFFILYLVRLGFGIFTLWWMPRAVATLARRVAEDDFAVHKASDAAAA